MVIPVTATAGLKRPEDLLFGALAVLSLDQVTTLRTNDRSFHDHFAEALKVFEDAGGEIAELASQFFCDVVSNTYDELDQALIAAEQYRFVGFPNPSYNRLAIRITPRAAERILAEWTPEQRDVFKKAAESLRKSIER
jgi:hypothetical protein